MDEERAARHLHAIDEVVGLAEEIGVQVWLRGGWAMDFYLGEITRDHGDIDWFAWVEDAPKLAAELVGRGYEPLPGPPPGQQLDFGRGDVELSFALLGRDEDGRVVVGGGPWKGEPWPDGMLDAPPGRLGRLRCPIISPAAQIEIKRMMPAWVPGMPRRPKDLEDVARLQAALYERRHAHPEARPGSRIPHP
ncbi:nucleotidyltransferase domain-containing protein [Microbispora amethystogenes]|uniref:Aminoglycoside adenylyltransferase n=1 Tax=Microbispora amethystogenes TaxID=1427754 RepID=A0ABQ4FLL8_9ACTN|nr:hypothetical protein [Microbispora amethystogenes]GIH35695.1 hypothetical protein Mam01_58590 [Microbispora amethystogenes]